MKILNYINGVLQAPVNNKYLDNTNPATGEIYGNIPRSDAEDVEAAVMAAKKAFPSWSALSAGQRSRRHAHMLDDRNWI